MFSSVPNALFRLKEAGMLMTIGEANATDCLFNNRLPDCMKVVPLSSTKKYYLGVTNKLVKEYKPRSMGTL